MNVFLFLTTVVLVFVFVFPLMRLFAVKCGIIHASHEFPSHPDQTGTSSSSLHSLAVSEGDDVCSMPSRGRSGLRYALSSVAGIVFLYYIASGRFSIDAMYTLSGPDRDHSIATASESHGIDWKVVDGVRWFRVIGTDSAGIAYNGWISELFLRDAPPEPSSETKGIMEKIGLPSVKEKIEGARQLRKIGKALEQALTKD